MLKYFFSLHLQIFFVLVYVVLHPMFCNNHRTIFGSILNYEGDPIGLLLLQFLLSSPSSSTSPMDRGDLDNIVFNRSNLNPNLFPLEIKKTRKINSLEAEYII